MLKYGLPTKMLKGQVWHKLPHPDIAVCGRHGHVLAALGEGHSDDGRVDAVYLEHGSLRALFGRLQGVELLTGVGVEDPHSGRCGGHRQDGTTRGVLETVHVLLSQVQLSLYSPRDYITDIDDVVSSREGQYPLQVARVKVKGPGRAQSCLVHVKYTLTVLPYNDNVPLQPTPLHDEEKSHGGAHCHCLTVRRKLTFCFFCILTTAAKPRTYSMTLVSLLHEQKRPVYNTYTQLKVDGQPSHGGNVHPIRGDGGEAKVGIVEVLVFDQRLAGCQIHKGDAARADVADLGAVGVWGHLGHGCTARSLNHTASCIENYTFKKLAEHKGHLIINFFTLKPGPSVKNIIVREKPLYQ